MILDGRVALVTGEAVGMPFRDRGRRMDEYIEAMRVLWRDDEPATAGST